MTNVTVTEWPANAERLAVTFVHVDIFEQIGVCSVDVALVTLSVSVTVNQSFLTLSEQDIRYQKFNLPPPAGTAKNCDTVLSADGDAEPTWAANAPLCDVETIAVAPVMAQPVKSPVSKPPFTMPLIVTVTAITVE